MKYEPILLMHRFYICTNCWFQSLFTLSDSFFLICLTPSNRGKSIYLSYLAFIPSFEMMTLKMRGQIEISISEVPWDRITEHSYSSPLHICMSHLTEHCTCQRPEQTIRDKFFLFLFWTYVSCTWTGNAGHSCSWMVGHFVMHHAYVCHTTASSFCGPDNF